MANFLICTMCCGERDYEHCIKAIIDQEGAHNIEYMSFHDMLEVDAHNAVYQAFNNAGPGVICGKVDADVVLHPNALNVVLKAMSPHAWVDPKTLDYFTDDALSAGLAFYGPEVTFQHQTQTLKCDRGVASTRTPQEIGVIGKHAHYADEWTGFHFGFHRGLKSQLPIHEKVKTAYAKHGDPVRLAAIIGFELAQSDLYVLHHMGRQSPPMDHNYGSPRLRELFEQYVVRKSPMLPRTWR